MKSRIFKKSNNLKLIIIGVSALFVFLSSCGQSNETPTIKDPIPVQDLQPDLPTATVDSSMHGIGEARDITSFELVAEMGVGWNLGNSFDVVSKDKTDWGNPLPNKAIIDAVSEMGFKTLRIPVTWEWNQSAIAPYQIELNYLERIKKIIDYGLENQMHVIIDLHHDNEWAKPIPSLAVNVNKRLHSLWTQVATYFKEYNESLIFEVMNEPRIKNIPQEWTGGTLEGRNIINDYLKTSVDAIRATGGNNAKRHLMIPTWAASTSPDAMNGLVIPNNDPKIIISLHSYFPYLFALEGQGTWGSAQDKADLRAEFDKIRQKWIVEEKRPVILGEWATKKTIAVKNRIEYAAFYAKEATARDLLTILWDDGGDYQLFNRNTLTWTSVEQAETIIKNAVK
ncbi:glycoside hydrolase family 5 protein [Aureibaculum algae]|uniref:Glycoside hydrolase family 5 protein n=1 Tax=Aureibaculum algae TaxID=2584122 RepID=A0A5B7TW80_9FLAO|nr:glycoside hydrolase family 5 protein [Aureibaculum algae]QCX40600.1 glycoside hydrolase family 5 protein [Aureibaculum algae]